MRIFIAGATGAIGRRLVPRLVADGHEVVAGTRGTGSVDALRAAGATAIPFDPLNRASVMAAVAAARPDAVIHQLTALARMRNLRRFDDEFAQTNRLRTEATDHLLAAARAAGAHRFIAQSYTGWPNERTGGWVKTEADPLDPRPPRMMTRSLAAIRHLETVVPAAAGLTGIVLRYGSFYGPGTSIARDGDIGVMVRARRFPLVGGGTAVWSFTHIDDAAEVTRLAVTRGEAGIYNVVDDEPAEVSVWLPELARALGAPPPRAVPAWIGRLVAGEVGVSVMTMIRGSSNARAKQAFDWQPLHPTWREGFRDALD